MKYQEFTDHNARKNIMKNLYRIPCVLFLGAILFLAAAGVTRAATFTVNNTTDLNDGSCDAADCSLREAINAANGAAGDDVIEFDPAVFSIPQTITLGGTHLVVTNNGTLTINGPGAEMLTISGGNTSMVFYLNNSSTGTFNHLTIADGAGVAGIYVYVSASLTVNNSVIRDSTAPNGGFLTTASSTLTINDTVISDNTGTSQAGGVSNAGTLTISNSIISNNTGATGGGGVGSVGGTVSINDSLISGNIASGQGAGVRNSAASMTITNTTIDGNQSTNTGGGGTGGGIYTVGVLVVLNSTISNNSAGTWGGGIYAPAIQPTKLINTTISGNSSQGRAGGIDILSNSMDIVNSTIVNNTACVSAPCEGGGGIRALGQPDIQNSIIANNTHTNGNSNDISGTINSFGYNLIEDVTGGTINGDATGNIIGVDPLLGPLQNNGGTTATHELLTGSPAIDMGSNALAVDQNSIALTTDQRGAGFPRIYNTTVDIGAFEVQPPPNQDPVALCQDVTITLDPGETTADANIDNGSYDPDEDSITLTQDPPGPYGVGDTLVTLTVEDEHGSTSSCTGTVTVEESGELYDFTGFFEPIDNDDINLVKAGRAIPIKFSLNGYQGLDILADNYPTSFEMQCSGDPIGGEMETDTSGSSGLSYDPETDQYIYVWKTQRGWKGQCRRLVVKLNDGSEAHTADFQFK